MLHVKQVRWAALDAVGDYEADPNVMLEDVPQDIVIKTLKVSCWCLRVCVRVRARDVDMCSWEFAFAFSDFCLCVCMQQGRYIAHKFESGWEVGVIKAFDKKS